MLMEKRTLALLFGAILATALLGCGEPIVEEPRAVTPPPEISATAEVDARLAGTQWELKSIEGLSLPETMRPPYIRFDADGARLSGFSGVNRISGGYTEIGDQIRLGNLAGTKMAGSPEAMAFEIAFMQMLRGDIAWTIEGDRLTLKSEGGATIQLISTAFEE